MRKLSFVLPVLFVFAMAIVPVPVLAAKTTTPAPMHLEEAKSEAQDVAAITKMLNELMDASNRHDIDGVLHHYSPLFISGDSLSVKDMRNLILDTWKMFPDIRYNSQILEVRTSGKWATVESLDTASASATIDPTVSNKPGTMKSRSRGLLYLQKTGKTWEVLSDYTLYEKAVIVYGPFDTIKVDVDTPEQVFASESYTAKVVVDVPTGHVAFATLSKEPLTYPQLVDKDKFRTLTAEKSNLERIFNANSTNNNEVVTATIGFTEIGQDEQERPTINLKGVMTVVKRVNVISKSTFSGNPESALIRRSADGKIQLEDSKLPGDEEDTETPGAGEDGPDIEIQPSD